MFNMRVSFDFDFTLSRPVVQKYARELISRGYELWIVTSRPLIIDNTDLLEVARTLGIPKERIVFTTFGPKSEPMLEINPIFHLDDDPIELEGINSLTQTKGVSCWNNTSWKGKCERILNLSGK